MSTGVSDLPNEALHLIYNHLLPRQCVLFSQTCRKTRHAANTLPEKFKKEIVLTMVGESFTRTYGLTFVSAEAMSQFYKEKFEQKDTRIGDTPLTKKVVNELNITPLKRRFKNSRALIDVLKPLLKVTILAKFRIITVPCDLARMDWFSVLRAITGNKHRTEVLTMDLNTFAGRSDTILKVHESLHPQLAVVNKSTLAIILWNIARTGIRSVDINFFFPYTVFSSVPMNWFQDLSLAFIVMPIELCGNALPHFEGFIRNYLEGGCKGTSFSFLFMLGAGAKMRRLANPLAAQLESVRSSLGQSPRICYHQDKWLRTAWNTMNKGEYRISWKGPVIVEQTGALMLRVNGTIDSDDAVPRTRPLTPALLKQIESSFLYMLNG